ncbi:hypothetical protein ACVOMS_31265 [Bradyrhizobium guangxiense]
MPKWNRLVRIALYAPGKQLIVGDVPSPGNQSCRDRYRALIPLNTLS